MTTAEAVAIIENAREIHVKWIAWFEKDSENGKQEEPIVQTAGDAAHHKLWVANYDVVLNALDVVRQARYRAERDDENDRARHCEDAEPGQGEQ